MKHEFASAQDGVLSDEEMDMYELVQVHIVTRHGDRSPVHPYIIGSPVFYECGLVDDHTGWIGWTGLRDFPSPQTLSHGEERAHYFSRHSLFPGTTSRQCGIGKLTRIGFHQLRALGFMLRMRYAEALLGNFTDEVVVKNIYAQSTDFPRTVQSAAAFLLGFLPDQPALRKLLTIHFSPGDRLEAPPPGITPLFQPCKQYFTFCEDELKKTNYYKTEKTKYHPLLEKLMHMFYLGTSNQPIIVKLFDPIATRGCHARNDPLPCYNEQCMDYDFANKLFAFSDWTFSNAGTEDSSLVGSLPFLRHSVLGLMEEAVQDLDESRKFILSTSHDSSMTKLLLAFGMRLEQQMPFASRITFELWRDKTAVVVDKSSFQVRILFNGEPITHRLTLLVQDSYNSHLLPYSIWESFLLTGTYRDTQSYDEACRNL